MGNRHSSHKRKNTKRGISSPLNDGENGYATISSDGNENVYGTTPSDRNRRYHRKTNSSNACDCSEEYFCQNCVARKELNIEYMADQIPNSSNAESARRNHLRNNDARDCSNEYFCWNCAACRELDIEYMADVHRKILQSILRVEDILQDIHCIDKRRKEEIENKSKESRQMAVKMLLESIQSSYGQKKWHGFIDALEKSGYNLIVKLLKGEAINDKENEALLSVVLEHLINNIQIVGCLDIFYAGELLDENDKAEIESELRNYGQIAAAYKMSKIIPTRSHECVRKLPGILDNCGLSDMAKSLKFSDDSSAVTVPFEIEHDPYALDLFIEALEYGKEEDRSIRINVVGNFDQGKTSLVRRLVGESVEGIESTNGIDVDRYICQKSKNGTLSYEKKDFQDTSDIGKRLVTIARANRHSYSCENANKMEEKSAKESITAGILIDHNDQTTSYDRDEMEKDRSESPVFLPQDSNDDINKAESDTSKYLMEEEFKSFKEQLRNSNNLNREPSCNPVSFDVWDFGGQYTFYATHTMFHSRKAIYVLVFNLSLGLHEHLEDEGENEDETCLSLKERDMKYFIRFWMNSIHSFVGNNKGTEPLVILVGTHKDQLNGDKRTKQKSADRYFSDIRDLFEGTHVINHIRSEDYAVDNTDETDESIKELREKIIEIGEENAKTVTIPAKWIQLEKQLIQNRHRQIVSVTAVMQMDAESDFPIANTEQIKVFLKYHHNKGTLCYFDEEPISSTVVLDPQYLIDAFKCIITSEKFCKKDKEIRPFWQKLVKEAKLEHALIDSLWKKEEEKGFMKHKDTVLEFLKKHHIISEVRFASTEPLPTAADWFIVPSFLREYSSDVEIAEFLTGKQQTQMRYMLSFDSTAITPMVYHRVIAAALGKWPVVQFRSTNLMYINLTVFRLDVYAAGLLELKNETIELTVVSLCPSAQVNADLVDAYRRFVVSTVEHVFSKLRDTEEEFKQPYEPKFRCNHSSHGLAGSTNLIKMSHLKDRKLLPCPDSESHEIFAERAMSEWFQESKWLKLIPKYELPDKNLSKISRAIGDNWELLGLELGLTEVEIQHIIDDNPHSVILRIYKMLMEWRRKESVATIDILVQRIKNCPGVSIDWDTIRNVIDEMIII